MRLVGRCTCIVVTSLALGFLAPVAASAYGGPGSIISGIGAFLAVLAAFVAAMFGFLWFPLKRLIRKLRGQAGGEDRNPGTGPEEMAPE